MKRKEEKKMINAVLQKETIKHGPGFFILRSYFSNEISRLYLLLDFSLIR